MVTPPSSESENLRRKVPDAEAFSKSSAYFRPTKPIIAPSIQRALKCSLVTYQVK